MWRKAHITVCPGRARDDTSDINWFPGGELSDWGPYGRDGLGIREKEVETFFVLPRCLTLESYKYRFLKNIKRKI